jgi:rubrerythrin
MLSAGDRVTTNDGGLAGDWACSGEWECMECGYIVAGVKTQPPESCSDCGAPSQALEFFPYGDEDEQVNGPNNG